MNNLADLIAAVDDVATPDGDADGYDDLDDMTHEDRPAAPIDLPDGATPEAEAAALIRANWHVRRIREVAADLAVLDAVYRAEFDALTLRYKNDRARLVREQAWHEAPCVQLHRRLLDANPRRATIKLPAGDLTSRTPKVVHFSIDDEPGFVKWAQEADRAALLRSTPKPDMATISKAYAEAARTDAGKVVDPATGEVIPGLTAAIPEPSFKVKPRPAVDA